MLGETSACRATSEILTKVPSGDAKRFDSWMLARLAAGHNGRRA